MVLDEKNVPKFHEDFIKKCDEDSNKGYILEIDVEHLKDFHNLHSNLPFLPERMNIKNAIRLYAICMIKKNMLFT